MEKRRKTLREKVIEKELKIYFYRKLEHILQGIKLELLKAKLKDMEAKKLMLEVQ